jgi:transposase InsO family protein
VLKDRSSAPLHCPTITHPEVVEKIIHLRQHYHFGPLKIEMYLRRYHDVEIAASTIYRILKRLGMNRLPASQRYKRHRQRWKRYEKQRPGHQLQIDVKFVEPITTDTSQRKRKFYQYTAIDDCTRLRILRIYPRSDQKTAIQFLDYVLSRLPFQVEKIQTDNGAEFQSAFHWHVLDQGIGHVYIRPATPRLNGKVERSHRIDAEEFYRLLDGVVLGDLGRFNDKLKEWEDYYNYCESFGWLVWDWPIRVGGGRFGLSRDSYNYWPSYGVPFGWTCPSRSRSGRRCPGPPRCPDQEIARPAGRGPSQC